MEQPSLHPLIAWVGENPTLTLVMIGLVAFAEALALVGLLVPGALLLFGLGAMVALGELSLAIALLIGVIGALTGDTLSYFLGRRYQHRLLAMWPFSHYQLIMVRGERFFQRYGATGIVIGRIIGATRPIVPVVAGMMNMPPWRFVPVAALACLLWAPIYILPGYVFGYSLDVAAGVALRLAMLMGIVAGLYFLARLLVKAVQHGVFQPLVDVLESLLRRAQRRPSLTSLTHWLEDPKLPRSGALGPLVLHCATGLTVWATMAWLVWQEVAPANDLLAWVMLDWREPWLDRLMLAVAGLGHPLVMLVVTAGIGTWLLYRRRHRTAVIWTVGVCAGAVVLQAWHMVAEIQVSASLWSLGGAKIVVLLGVYAVLISSQLPTRPRLSSYIAASTVAMAVILAQIYLGATSVFAAVSGIALASAWSSALGIAYRIGNRRHFLANAMGRWFYGLLLAGTLFGGVIWHDQLARQHRIVPAKESVQLSQWRSDQALALDALEHPRSNLLIAAEPDTIGKRLSIAGFEYTRDFDWQQLLQILRPNPQFEQLPVMPRTRHARAPELVMTRAETDGALVVRLWASNVTLEDHQPLLVGSVNRQTIGQRWYFFSLREERLIGRDSMLDIINDLPTGSARLTPQPGRRENQWGWLLRVDLTERPNDPAPSDLGVDARD